MFDGFATFELKSEYGRAVASFSVRCCLLESTGDMTRDGMYSHWT